MRFAISNLKLLLPALVLAVGVCAPSSSAQEAGQIVVSLGAVDKEGRPVEGLRAEDVRVTVEGQPQQLLSFDRRAEEPLHVVILLDASASQEKVLPFVQGAADRLVPALLARGGSDDAAVVSFTGDAKVVQGLTADAAAVRRAIASVEVVVPPGYAGGGVVIGRPRPNDPANRAGSTAVWDALVVACDEVFARARPGRRAVLLVTDGVDTSSRVRLDKAVERLLREGVVVYGVGVGDEKDFEGVYQQTVRRVSEQTGGRALFPKKNSDLPVAFEQVRRELLTSSYALTFAAPAPPRKGKSLKLRVELVNPALRKQDVQLAYPQALFK
jgi:VWFA-related protein